MSRANGAFLVIQQPFLGYTSEILQTANDPFINVFTIQAVRAPEVKPPRISQLIHDEPYFRGFPTDNGAG